ncbi:unnamed protein product [marine sediment metagenome]|uniref:Uncharacterized protein n=1 Tax=marine sediment metagenome TaxID=412755 RepID=X1U030_9ZZZZ
MSTDVPVADVSGMGVGQLIPIMKEMGEDIKEIKGSDDERKQRDLLEKESNGPDVDVIFSGIFEKFKEIAEGVDLKERFFGSNEDVKEFKGQLYVDVCVAVSDVGGKPYVLLSDGFFAEDETVGDRLSEMIYNSIYQKEDEDSQAETLKRVVVIAQGEDDPGEGDPGEDDGEDW